MNLHNVREALSAHDADLSKSSFTNVSLTESRFDDVNLRGATCTNANLTGMVFFDVNLTGASISNVNVAGMRINGILVDDLMRAYRSTGGAVLYAKNRSRLQRFYQDVLGFALGSAQSGHAVLTSPALRLVIVEMPEHVSSSITIDNPPRLRSECPTKLVFATKSIATVRATARERGGEVLSVEHEWEFDGARLCDGNDPEGNVFQLREERVSRAFRRSHSAAIGDRRT